MEKAAQTGLNANRRRKRVFRRRVFLESLRIMNDPEFWVHWLGGLRLARSGRWLFSFTVYHEHFFDEVAKTSFGLFVNELECV